MASWRDLADDFFRIPCPAENCWGEVSWTEWPDGRGGLLNAGYCSSCGIFGVECPECGSVTALDWDEVECFGCDTRFVTARDSDSYNVESLVLIPSSFPPLK